MSTSMSNQSQNAQIAATKTEKLYILNVSLNNRDYQSDNNIKIVWKLKCVCLSGLQDLFI